MAIGLSEWYRLKNLNPGYFLRSAVWFTPNTLPVVGIDAVAAQDILFALRAADSQGRIADVWLRALQLAQLAHDRLLRDLHDVDRNLSFWQGRVSAGGVWSHGAFMLLSMGPLSFAEDVAGAAKDLVTRRLAPLMAPLLRTFTSPSPYQQQSQEPQAALKAGAQGVQASSSSAFSSSSLPTEPSHGSASATDMMQQRVLLLRGLRLRLARALALLTQAADLLRVGDVLAAAAPRVLPSTVATTTGDVGSSKGALNVPMLFFTAAAAAAVEARGLPSFSSSRRHQEHEDPVVKVVEDAVCCAVRGMRVAIEGLLMDAGCGPDAQYESQQQQQPPNHSNQQQDKGQSGDERSLSRELQRLSDLLRLRPPAVQGLGQPLEPEYQRPAVALASSRAAPPAAAAAVGSASGGAADLKDHPMGLHLTAGGGSAAAALGAARRAAALAVPLVPLPATARMPSRFQRHWLRYGLGAGLLLYGGIFLVRHSRLAGSDDLDSWIQTAVSSVRSALRTHVAEPLAAVRDELFRTFRDRPAIVSPQDFSLSRESLLRMLTDFSADHPKDSAATTTSSSPSITNGNVSSPVGGTNGATITGSESASQQSSRLPQGPSISGMTAVAPSTGGARAAAADGSHGGCDGGESATEEEDAALAEGMAVLMRSYEAELRNPLRNLLLGDLARALLIQVQHLKVDGEAAMLRLDQILRANELSLSLMAALPAMGISLALAVGLTRLLIPRAPDPKRAAVPSRLAMASLEVDLAQLSAAEEEWRQQQQQQQLFPHAAASNAAMEELRGLVVYRLYRVYSDVTALYATADRTSRYSEWRQLYADLLRLAGPATPQERLATHQRMMRTYSVFQR
ncbi:hypothetical protein Vretifemale_8467 [Volvox reticuliferus]|uniref:Uncharacterized protein n=3 Tax=Volvox reticuliferus TaxID=1737510 RepID=A0A8J4CI38_9CHLO|nr:hypothetical protein Vretifemale_8467 [Volvox reticuliferus]